jgi:16S rRNA (uracil1498-N3)-methyltransferase
MAWVAVPAACERWMLLPGAAALAGHAAPQGALELLVGPEGGFSERERDLALGQGAQPVSLGERVLRTETAPLAALAAIHALWGDFCP